jgi:hypothetical protein
VRREIRKNVEKQGRNVEDEGRMESKTVNTNAICGQKRNQKGMRWKYCNYV